MKNNKSPTIRIVYGSPGRQNKNIHSASTITNSRTTFKNQYNHEHNYYDFDSKIDTRDEQIRVPFSIKDHLNDSKKQLQSAILEWLATIVENILSVSFRYILEEKLMILEGKAFAAKNILLNIKETCEAVNKYMNVQIDSQFMNTIDKNLQSICSEVIRKYPQTNTKGASNKLKGFIRKISNRDNEQYDFLRNNKIVIKYNSNGDYSSDIMSVINKIIQTPQEEEKNDSLFQEFQIFCTELFYKASQNIQKQADNGYISQKFPSSQSLDGTFKSSNHNNRNSVDDKTLKQFKDIQKAFKQQRILILACKDLAFEIINSTGQVTQKILKFQEKKKQLFKIGQKISPEVRTFTSQEINSGSFTVHHSAILRVMTKWSDELYRTINEASDKIRHRVHKFKTNDHKLRFCQVNEKEYLYQIATQEKAKIDKYFKSLQIQNKELQSIFSTQICEGMYLKNFTNVNVYSGKIEQVLGQLTFKYLNRLIHSLLNITQEAGDRISEHYKLYRNNLVEGQRKRKQLSEINLVSLKIGDLLRARYVCLEHELTKILAILYKIEEDRPSFLKIVKIKNRLNDKSNDILINLFFKQKILCQIQLGIFREVNAKQSLYSQFNHFIYELIRSDFGVLSSLSNIIAQHDPVVNYFIFQKHKKPTVIPKYYPDYQKVRENERKLRSSPRKRSSQDITVTNNDFDHGIEKPFICNKCKNLKIVHNIKFYYRTVPLEFFCNECVEQSMVEHPQLCQDTIKSLFRLYVNDEQLNYFMDKIALWHPEQALKGIKNEKDLFGKFLEFGFMIEKGGKMPQVKFFKKTFNKMNNQIVLSTISSDHLNNFLKLDCSKQKEKYVFYSKLKNYLIFQIKNYTTKMSIFNAFLAENGCLLEQTYETDMEKLLTSIDEEQILKKQYIKQVYRSFEMFHPTLYLNNYKNVLCYLEQDTKNSDSRLNEKKQSFFNEGAMRIVNLQLESTEIAKLEPILSLFVNLKEINLSSNSISSLEGIEDLKKLVKINVSSNKLSDIDSLTGLQDLTTIIASHNMISKLPSFSSTQKFQSLNFSYNILRQLNQLGPFTNLLQLDVSQNYLQSTKGIGKLFKLKILNVKNNELNNIEELESLVNLVQLDISSNWLPEIPDLTHQSKLVLLDCSDNKISKIRQIPCEFIRQLDLSNNEIAAIEGLGELKNLQILDLQKNCIKRIEGLKQNRKLKQLSLGINKIEKIQNLDELILLERLKLTHNPIKQINNLNHLKKLDSIDVDECQLLIIKNISKLKKLKTLNLCKNILYDIQQIGQLVRAERLDLANNKITKIDHLNYLKYLQRISLMENQIQKIENLDQLSELKWIILSNNRITKLENLDQLDNLNILQVQFNKIQTIQNINNLKSLTELWLSFNKIKKIQNLESLKSLKKLGLAKNQISKIEGLEYLSNLEFIDLQANRLTKLQNLDHVAELRCLVISLNKISKLQNLNNLTQLQILIVEHNEIQRIQNIEKLRRLTTLILSNNRIESIENLNSLQDLQNLTLSSNQISKIEGLDYQFNLKQLNLEDNHIWKIDNIWHLKRLKLLNLSRNQITSIRDIDQMKNLTKIELEGNKIENTSDMNLSELIDNLNLANNPVSHYSLRGSFRYFLNPLMKEVQQIPTQIQYEKRHSYNYKEIKNKISQLLASEENINNSSEDIEKQIGFSDLVRCFTKTIVTQY